VALLRPLDDFDVHHHAVKVFHVRNLNRFDSDTMYRLSGFRNLHAFRNLNPLLDTFIVRLHIAAVPADVKLSNDGDMCTLEDADNLAVGATVCLYVQYASEYAVAVHCFFGRFRRDEEIALHPLYGIIRDYKAVPVSVHVQAADDILAAGASDL